MSAGQILCGMACISFNIYIWDDKAFCAEGIFDVVIENEERCRLIFIGRLI